MKKLMTLPEAKMVKVSVWRLSCPYCGKKLDSMYIKQLNQHYLAHTQKCKANIAKKK